MERLRAGALAIYRYYADRTGVAQPCSLLYDGQRKVRSIEARPRVWEEIMTRMARCRCGALHAEVSGDPIRVIVCHCDECQRRTGSVFGVGAALSRKPGRGPTVYRVGCRHASVLLPPPSLPARDHPARDLALSPLHPELPRCR